MAESKSDEIGGGEPSNELIVGHGPGLIHRFVNFAFNVSNFVGGEGVVCVLRDGGGYLKRMHFKSVFKK